MCKTDNYPHIRPLSLIYNNSTSPRLIDLQTGSQHTIWNKMPCELNVSSSRYDTRTQLKLRSRLPQLDRRPPSTPTKTSPDRAPRLSSSVRAFFSSQSQQDSFIPSLHCAAQAICGGSENYAFPCLTKSVSLTYTPVPPPLELFTSNLFPRATHFEITSECGIQ